VEALEQSLWRILFDWPRCAGGHGDAESLGRLRRQLRVLKNGVFPEKKWDRLGGAQVKADDGELLAAVETIAGDVDEIVFGGVCGRTLLSSRSTFEEWVGEARCATADVLGWVRSNGLEDFGGGEIRLARDFDTEYISDRLANDDTWEYCRRPDDHGEVHQTGALAHWADAQLIGELQVDFGYGLTTQLAARLLEVVSLIDTMRESILALEPEATNGSPSIATGRGLGSVDTARGRLFHWVEVRDGTIARYRTLAPTEWNFHPRGPVALGLIGAPAGDAEAVRQAVDLLVTAIDPCVGTELEIAEA
jgi:hypothetical protein